jgi:hypothetical protein
MLFPSGLLWSDHRKQTAKTNEVIDEIVDKRF